MATYGAWASMASLCTVSMDWLEVVVEVGEERVVSSCSLTTSSPPSFCILLCRSEQEGANLPCTCI